MKKTKNPFWFYLILVLLPFIFIIIFEFSLRVLDYGVEIDQWKDFEDNTLILNPEIAKRYFNDKNNIPHSNNDSFSKSKGKNTFRIFVLGGSTTAGFPYSPNGTFPRYVKELLELNYPNKRFEVINLGLTAVNSYTVLDLLPGVIDQSPDLIILYLGHNEYYGALGVGSTQSFLNSPMLTNLYLKIQDYKTVQLLRDIISWLMESFSSEDHKGNDNTLMARMAAEQTIEMNSDLYNSGLKQFENNLNEIFKIIRENNIPILVGSLVSNIKDQKPFVSTSYKNQSANELYEKGLKLINERNFNFADSLLQLAKDLDGLRFRAPTQFNTIIRTLSKDFQFPIVDIEKGFKTEKNNFIVGKDLMIDHLHPNLDGYFLMGKLFYEAIIDNNFLPETDRFELKGVDQDSLIKNNFPYSKLDSVISDYRINNLLNGWPFKEKSLTLVPNLPDNEIEKLAYRVVYNNLDWRVAHQEAYNWYLNKKDFENFSKEIDVLLSQYPYKLEYYNYGAEKLLMNKEYNLALKFIKKRYKLAPDAFSTKWLGNISLINKEYQSAIKFYLESIKYQDNDIQTFYNLGLSFYRINEIDNAIKAIEFCLKLNSKYEPAKLLLKQITEK